MSDEFNNGQATPETPAPDAAPTPAYAEPNPAPTPEYAAPNPQPAYQDQQQYGAPNPQPMYQDQQQYGAPPQYAAPTPGKAIAALILGIASLVLFWIPFLNLGLGIAGIVLAKSAERERKTGIGTGGFVTGIIGTIIGAISVIFWLVVGAAFMAAIPFM